MANKVNSNATGLSIAEETSLKVLPVTPVWYGLEPNSYGDFGGDTKTEARAPIDPSRQDRKGTVTDEDASGAFNIDFTKTNLARVLQGFFFADAHEPESTAPLNTAALAFTSAAAADHSYNAAAGLGIFAASELAFASGFTNLANNGVKTVATVAAGKVTVAETVVDEPAPPVAAKLQRVGHQFAAADIAIVVTSGIPAMTSIAADFTLLGNWAYPGNWIFIGGDIAGTRFANNVGYARIATVAAHAITFDDTSFAAVTEAGTGKTIRIFFGVSYHNESNPALQKKRSYNLERTLGQGANGQQAEYIEGSVPNEFTLNVPKTSKLTADLSFVGCVHRVVTGDPGDTIKAGIRIPVAGEEAYNTSRDVVRIKMAVLDPTTSAPTALFGFVDTASVKISNGVTPDKAVGVLGAFDTSEGNFKVSGSVTAMFTTVAAVNAIRNNADVGLSVIGASKNAGMIFDVPLVGLGGGRLAVEKDSSIKLPLDASGAGNKYGYTMLTVIFAYLPTIAMPT